MAYVIDFCVIGTYGVAIFIFKAVELNGALMATRRSLQLFPHPQQKHIHGHFRLP
jgi:hypothetical protein